MMSRIDKLNVKQNSKINHVVVNELFWFFKTDMFLLSLSCVLIYYFGSIFILKQTQVCAFMKNDSYGPLQDHLIKTNKKVS